MLPDWSWPSSTSLQAKVYLSLPVLAIHSDLFFAISMHEPIILVTAWCNKFVVLRMSGRTRTSSKIEHVGPQRCRGKLAIWHAVCQEFFHVMWDQDVYELLQWTSSLCCFCFQLPVRVRWRSNYHLAKLSQSVLHNLNGEMRPTQGPDSGTCIFLFNMCECSDQRVQQLKWAIQRLKRGPPSSNCNLQSCNARCSTALSRRGLGHQLLLEVTLLPDSPATCWYERCSRIYRKCSETAARTTPAMVTKV